jgi:2-polyprenyl-6-methoxyphenol hydroxylase-like FAD-dependent oxidoreductase
MAYDAIVIGGGLAGSAFAGQMARAGRRILVLEREERFRDRVRGECMSPWGVAAARRLGLVDDLVAAGGRTLSSWITYAQGEIDEVRDLCATTPHGAPALNLYHPDLQEALLRRAVSAGADVRRGATVTGLQAGPGRSPAVTVEHEGKTETIGAPIVVGADGRASQVRRWAGFAVNKNPDLLTIAGTLFQGCEVPDDAVHLTFGPGVASLVAPLGGKRARAYFVYPGVAARRGLSGAAKVDEFVGCCQAAGFPASWFAGAESDGPLAEFDGADRWVEHPAKHGVVLIGDAAASTDPSWGQGLALSVVDVEHLTDLLRSSDDWSAALDRYAGEHDEYYAALHRILAWMTELVWTAGPEADARRGRVFPRLKADPTGFPDFLGMGPFGPSDENARRLILGLA